MSKKYDDSIKYWVYQKKGSTDYYAIEIAEVIILDTYYSDMDNFLYAPDDLFVECTPITFNRNNGMIEFYFDKKIQVKVKNLVKRGISISK